MASSDRLVLIKRYFCRLWRYWPAACGMIFCMILSAFLEPLLALMLKPLLDGGEGFIVSREHIPYFVAVVMLTLPAAAYGRTYLGGWLDITLQRDLRREMAERLTHMPLGALTAESSGKTTTRFMQFVPSFTGATLPVFMALAQEPLKTLFYLTQMFYLEWQLALLVCAALPPTALMIRILSRRMRKVAVRAQDETARSQSGLNESLRLLPIVKVHGDDAAHERLSSVFASLRGAMLRVQIVIAAGQPLSMLLVAIPSVAVLFYVVWALEDGSMSAGDVAAFLGCMLLMPRSVRIIARSATLLEGMLAAAREVFGFLDSPQEDNSGKKEITRARGEIAFDNIAFQYPGAPRPALSGVSAIVRAGETVALVGRSGAGKTTLANLLPRFYAPQSGAVRLDGEDTRQLTLRSLRAQIALVTQEALLFDDTIAANVCYPETPHRGNRERILLALQNAAAEEFVTAMPKGEDSPVGENGRLLSGGQRQRIALARAFYRDAPIVILDEATSALDSTTEEQIRAAMQRLLEGRTALIIAHRFAVIDFAERALVLDGGQLVAAGTPAELLKTCPLYADLYRAQHVSPTPTS